MLVQFKNSHQILKVDLEVSDDEVQDQDVARHFNVQGLGLRVFDPSPDPLGPISGLLDLIESVDEPLNDVERPFKLL